MAHRITHALVEVLRKGSPKTRITHGLVEVLRGGDPKLRITHGLVEVLRDSGFTTTTSTTTTTIPIAQVRKGLGFAVLTVPDGAVVQKGLGFAVLEATTTTSTTTTSTTSTTTTAPPFYVEDVVIRPPTTTTTTSTTTTSTTGPPPVGSTTTTTTTTTSTFTTTTSTTTTTTFIPPIGYEWGEEDPDDNVSKGGWGNWKLSDGSSPYTNPPSGAGSVSNWKCLILFPNQEVYSDVVPLPSGWKTLTVEKNRYSNLCCGGYVNVWIRGDTSIFLWDDVSPAWNLYTSPIYTDWNYAQLRVKMSLTGTTTTT